MAGTLSAKDSLSFVNKHPKRWRKDLRNSFTLNKKLCSFSHPLKAWRLPVRIEGTLSPQRDYHNASDYTSLMVALKRETFRLGVQSGSRIVAFSGGVDSSLVAYLVKSVFPLNSIALHVGVSPSMPSVQLESARLISAHLGIHLTEIQTKEETIVEYVANEGNSCYFCKTTLYATMKAIGLTVLDYDDPILFNGTNADDLKDPTRLGLIAAKEFKVASPLATVSKATVRSLAKLAGLPNWNLAAAPCLRSRLDFGVPATKSNLYLVEIAEDYVRKFLNIQKNENMRVRLMAENIVDVELDSTRMNQAEGVYGLLYKKFQEFGLLLREIKPFKSGSLSRKAG